jgi:hypothetical protein
MSEHLGEGFNGGSHRSRNPDAIMSLVERLMREKVYEEPQVRAAIPAASEDEGKAVNPSHIANILSAPYASLSDDEKKILNNYVQKIIFANTK